MLGWKGLNNSKVHYTDTLQRKLPKPKSTEFFSNQHVGITEHVIKRYLFVKTFYSIIYNHSVFIFYCIGKIFPNIFQFNPLTPMSDQGRISPYSINTISTR